jgi:hypothetical protein
LRRPRFRVPQVTDLWLLWKCHKSWVFILILWMDIVQVPEIVKGCVLWTWKYGLNLFHFDSKFILETFRYGIVMVRFNNSHYMKTSVITEADLHGSTGCVCWRLTRVYWRVV